MEDESEDAIEILQLTNKNATDEINELNEEILSLKESNASLRECVENMSESSIEIKEYNEKLKKELRRVKTELTQEKLKNESSENRLKIDLEQTSSKLNLMTQSLKDSQSQNTIMKLKIFQVEQTVRSQKIEVQRLQNLNSSLESKLRDAMDKLNEEVELRSKDKSNYNKEIEKIKEENESNRIEMKEVENIKKLLEKEIELRNNELLSTKKLLEDITMKNNENTLKVKQLQSTINNKSEQYKQLLNVNSELKEEAKKDKIQYQEKMKKINELNEELKDNKNKLNKLKDEKKNLQSTIHNLENGTVKKEENEKEILKNTLFEDKEQLEEILNIINKEENEINSNKLHITAIENEKYINKVILQDNRKLLNEENKKCNKLKNEINKLLNEIDSYIKSPNKITLDAITKEKSEISEIRNNSKTIGNTIEDISITISNTIRLAKIKQNLVNLNETSQNDENMINYYNDIMKSLQLIKIPTLLQQQQQDEVVLNISINNNNNNNNSMNESSIQLVEENELLNDNNNENDIGMEQMLIDKLNNEIETRINKIKQLIENVNYLLKDNIQNDEQIIPLEESIHNILSDILLCHKSLNILSQNINNKINSSEINNMIQLLTVHFNTETDQFDCLQESYNEIINCFNNSNIDEINTMKLLSEQVTEMIKNIKEKIYQFNNQNESINIQLDYINSLHNDIIVLENNIRELSIECNEYSQYLDERNSNIRDSFNSFGSIRRSFDSPIFKSLKNSTNSPLLSSSNSPLTSSSPLSTSSPSRKLYRSLVNLQSLEDLIKNENGNDVIIARGGVPELKRQNKELRRQVINLLRERVKNHIKEYQQKVRMIKIKKENCSNVEYDIGYNPDHQEEKINEFNKKQKEIDDKVQMINNDLYIVDNTRCQIIPNIVDSDPLTVVMECESKLESIGNQLKIVESDQNILYINLVLYRKLLELKEKMYELNSKYQNTNELYEQYSTQLNAINSYNLSTVNMVSETNISKQQIEQLNELLLKEKKELEKVSENLESENDQIELLINKSHTNTNNNNNNIIDSDIEIRQKIEKMIDEDISTIYQTLNGYKMNLILLEKNPEKIFEIVNILQNENSEITSDLVIEKESTEKLLQENIQLKDTIENKDKEIEDENKRYKNLEKQLLQFDQEQMNLKEEINELNKQLTENKETIEELQSFKDKYDDCGPTDLYEERILLDIENCNNYKDVIDNNNEIIKILSSIDTIASKDEYKETNTKINDSQMNLSKYIEVLNDLKTNLDNFIDDSSANSEVLKNIHSQLQSVEKSINSNYQSNFDTINNNINLLLKLLPPYYSNFISLKDTSVNYLSNSYTAIINTIYEFDIQLDSNIKEDLEIIKNNKNESEITKKQLLKDYNMIKEKLVTIKNGVDNQFNELENITNNEIDDINVEDLQVNINKYNKNMNNLISIYHSFILLMNNIKKNMNEIIELDDLERLENQYQNISNKYKEVNTNEIINKYELNEYNEKCKLFENNIVNVKNKINEIKKNIILNNNNSSPTVIKEEINKMNELIFNLNNNIQLITTETCHYSNLKNEIIMKFDCIKIENENEEEKIIFKMMDDKVNKMKNKMEIIDKVLLKIEENDDNEKTKEYKIKLNEIKKSILKEEKIYNDLNNSNNNINNITNVQNDLLNIENEVNELENEVNNEKDKQNDNEIEMLNNNNKILEENLQQTSTIFEQYKVNNLDNRCNKTKNEIKELECKSKEINDILFVINNKEMNENEYLIDKKDKFNQLKSNITDLNEKILSLKDEVSTLQNIDNENETEEDKTERLKRIKELEEEIEKYEKLLPEYVNEINIMSNAISYYSQMNLLINEVKNIQNNNDKLKKEIDLISDYYNVLNEEDFPRECMIKSNNNNNNNNNNKDKEIKPNLNPKKMSYMLLIEELKYELENKQNELKELNHNISECDYNDNNNSVKVNEMKKRKNQIENEIKDIEMKYKSLDSTLLLIKAEIQGKLTNKISVTESNLSNLDQMNENIKSKILEIEMNQNTNELQTKTFKDTNTNVVKKVEEIKSNFKLLKSKLLSIDISNENIIQLLQENEENEEKLSKDILKCESSYKLLLQSMDLYMTYLSLKEYYENIKYDFNNIQSVYENAENTLSKLLNSDTYNISKEEENDYKIKLENIKTKIINIKSQLDNEEKGMIVIEKEKKIITMKDEIIKHQSNHKQRSEDLKTIQNELNRLLDVFLLKQNDLSKILIELSKVKENKEDIENALSLLTKDYEKLESENENINRECEELKQQLNNDKDNIHSLEEKIIQYQYDSNSLKQKTIRMEEALTNESNIIEEYKNDIIQYKEYLQNNSESFKLYYKNLLLLLKETENTLNKFDEIPSIHLFLEKKNILESFDKVKYDIIGVENDINDFEKSLEVLNSSAVDNNNENILNIHSKLIRLETIIDSYYSSLINVQKNYGILLKEVERMYKSSNENSYIYFENTNNSIDTLLLQIDTFNQSKDLENVIEKYKTQPNSNPVKLNFLENEINSLNKSIKECETNLNNLKESSLLITSSTTNDGYSSPIQLSKSLASLSSSSTTTTTVTKTEEMKKVNNTIIMTMKKIDETKQKFVDINKNINNSIKVSELYTKYLELIKLLTYLKQNIPQLNNLLSNIESKNITFNIITQSDIKTIRNLLKANEYSVKTYDTTITISNKTIEGLNECETPNMEKFTEYYNQYDNIHKNLQKRQSQLDTLKMILNVLNNIIETINKTNTKLTNKNTELAKNIDDLKSCYSCLYILLNQIITDTINNRESSLHIIEKYISNTSENYQYLVEQNNNNSGNYTKEKEEINKIQNDLSSLSSELINIKQEYNKLQQQQEGDDNENIELNNFTELCNRLQNMFDNINNTNKTNEILNKILLFNQQKIKFNNVINKYNKNFDFYQNCIGDIELSINSINSISLVKHTVITDLQNQVQSVRNLFIQYQKQIIEIKNKNDIDSNSNSSNSNQLLFDKLVETLENYDNNIKQSIHSIYKNFNFSYISDLTETQQMIQQIQNEYDYLNRNYLKLDETLNNSKIENEKLKNNLKSLESEKLKLEQIQDDYNKLISKLEEADSNTDPNVIDMKKCVRNARNAVMSARASYSEIRKYDVPPKEKPFQVLMCCLYLVDYITDVQFTRGFSYEIVPHYNPEEQNIKLSDKMIWNYVRKFIDYQLVSKITKVDITKMKSSQEVIKIKQIKEVISKIELSELDTYSKAYTVSYQLIKSYINLHDAVMRVSNSADGAAKQVISAIIQTIDNLRISFNLMNEEMECLSEKAHLIVDDNEEKRDEIIDISASDFLSEVKERFVELDKELGNYQMNVKTVFSTNPISFSDKEYETFGKAFSMAKTLSRASQNYSFNQK